MKYIRRTLAAFIVIFALLVSFLTLTASGRFVLASTLSGIVSNENQVVQVEGLSGLWSGNFALDRLKIADAQGVWLDVVDVAVTWQPTDLVSGRFNARRVHIGKVNVLRQPSLPPEESSNGSGLPLDVDLQAIAIDELALGKAIAGTPALLELQSRIAVSGDFSEAELDLKIARIDGNKGDLDLAALYAPAEGKVMLRGTLQEDKDGMLAGILQLKDTPAVRMNLDGSGPLDNWQFSMAANLDDTEVLNIDGTVSANSEHRKIRLKGIGRPRDFVPPAYRRLVGDTFDLDLDIENAASGSVQVKKAKLDFERFFFAATGNYDPSGNNQITGGFQARDAGLNFSGGIIPGIKNLIPRNLAFSISGKGEKARIDLLADIPLIDTGTMQANAIKAQLTAPDFNLADRSGEWTLDASIDSITSDNPDIARVFPGSQSFAAGGSLSEETLTVRQMTFSNASLGAKAVAEYSIAENTWNAGFETRLLARGLPEEYRTFLKDGITASGNLAGDTQQNLRADNLILTAGTLKGTGNLDLGNDEIAASLAVDAPALDGLVEGLAASAKAKLEVSGTPEMPEIDLTISADNLVFNNHKGDDLLLTVKGLAAVQTPDLNVQLGGTLDGQSIAGQTRLTTQNGLRRLEDLIVENGPNNISGNLQFDDQFLPTGIIDVNLPKLEALAALALQEMSGSLSGKVNFEVAEGTPNLALRLQSNGLVFQENTISDLDIAADLLNYRAAPQPRGRLSAKRIITGTNTIRDLKVDFAGDDPWTGFKIAATANEVPVDLAGRVRPGEPTDIEITSANAQVQAVRVSLAEPASIAISQGNVNLNRVVLQVGRGQIAVSGSVAENLEVVAQLTGLDVGLANQFADGLGASGSVSGRINASGKPAAPVVVYDLVLKNISLQQTREIGIGSLAIASNGKFQNNRLNFTSVVTGPPGLKVRAGGSVAVKNPVSLDVDIAGDIPFPLLAKQLGNQGILLSGTARLDARVSGPANRPAIAGNINAKGVRFVHVESGIAIDNMALGITVADETASIKKLTGELSTGGSLAASGTVGLSPASGFPADVKLKVNNGVYTDHKSVSSEFDADISMTGSLVNDPLISGTVNLNRTTVTIPERLPPSIAKLNITHKNAAEDVSAQVGGLEQPEPSSASGIRMDLHIRALQKIFVRGRGLDAELGGELKLVGALSSPRALGAFQVRRGRFSILGKRLDFTRGEMKFSGSLVPDLNMRAETQRDEYAIFIDVTGPADNPTFGFSSSPALSEDEVLARLVFGAELRSLSALQILKLGQAAATLAGYGGNSSLLDKFQGLIGADDLDIKTDETTGQTTVGVGKYINDQLYVGVERGAEAASGKARIDLSIGNGLKLRGEASESGQNKAGIFFERDY